MFAEHGVPVLAGAVATTPEEARAAAERIGPKSGGVTVVKAQVKTGGRGKAGGVKVAQEPRRGAGRRPRRSSAWTSRATPSHRDDRPGRPDRRGVLLLGAARPGQPHLPRHVLQGGRHGDRAARRRAPRGARPRRGRPQRRHRRGQGRRRSSTPPASGRPTRPQIADVLQKLWTVYREEDATLVEVNPLVKTEDGEIVALDGKVTLDENAGFRHPEHEALEDTAPPTRSRQPPRRRTSTTSSSTARSASSATARAWS